MFRFDDNVRPTVERLLTTMGWSNLHGVNDKFDDDGHSIYASQRYVFRKAYNELMAIVEEKCGKKVADYASREFNWEIGGANWLEKFEFAVQYGLSRVAFEKTLIIEIE